MKSMAYRPPWLQKREFEASGLRITKQRVQKTSFPSAPDLESEHAFPSLGEELRPKKEETLDFASAANKIENVSEEDDEETAVPRGWACMRMKNGKIIDRRPPATTLLDIPTDGQYADRVLTGMVKRWQSERDSLNELLGDMSPYWDSLPIGEELEED